jgi:hypothetical protein
MFQPSLARGIQDLAGKRSGAGHFAYYVGLVVAFEYKSWFSQGSRTHRSIFESELFGFEY